MMVMMIVSVTPGLNWKVPKKDDDDLISENRGGSSDPRFWRSVKIRKFNLWGRKKFKEPETVAGLVVGSRSHGRANSSRRILIINVFLFARNDHCRRGL